MPAAALGSGSESGAECSRTQAQAALSAATPAVGALVSGSGAGRGFARGGQHRSNEIGGIARTKLLHDVGAMEFDGARTDAKLPARLLVGSAGREQFQHFPLAACQRIASGEIQR